MELEIIVLSEMSQTEKDKHCVFLNMNNRNAKTGSVWVWGRRWKERVKGGEYGQSTLYTRMKIEQWDLLKLF
jgi:hypothetical protein